MISLPFYFYGARLFVTCNQCVCPFLVLTFNTIALERISQVGLLRGGCFTFVLAALGGIFSQIISEDDIVREKAIKFLSYSVQTLLKDVFHPNAEIEMYLFQEIRKV